MIDPFVRDFMGSEICCILDLLDIGTSEAERAGVLKCMPEEVFMALKPGDYFKGIDTRVYRSHVRELIRRYKAGRSLQPGTEAEVLLGLVETSKAAPLNQGGAALYHHLFLRIMGAEAHDQVLGDMAAPRERWAGQTLELLAEAQRQVKTNRTKKVTPPPSQLELVR